MFLPCQYFIKQRFVLFKKITLIKNGSKIPSSVTKRTDGCLKLRLFEIKKNLFFRDSFHIHYKKMYNLIN